MRRNILTVVIALASCTPSGLVIQPENDAGEFADSGFADGGPTDAEDIDRASMDAGQDSGEAHADICYLDRDNDGVGAGDPVNCDDPYAGEDFSLDAGVDADGGVDADADAGDAAVEPARPGVVERGDDCDDADPRRAPILTEACDAVDNDCDGDVDEGAKNACGGTCEYPFEAEPGDQCDNAQVGACARSGKYVCKGLSEVVCSAPVVVASSELCGDGMDNDCDGQTDEPDAVDASLWYQDCDRDGYAASTSGSIRSCSKPADAGGCTWTQVTPHESTMSNWDCDDSSAAYKPGAAYGTPPPGFTSWDLDCNGALTKDPEFRTGNGVAPSDLRHKQCNSAVVAWANKQGGSCSVEDIGPSAADACLLWRNAAGVYERTPSLACPDVPYRVQWDNAWEWCSIGAPRAAVWPCR